jgi:hypothetical protein
MKQGWHKILMLFVVLSLIIIRFINLEQDINFTGLSFYNEFDQFAYVDPSSNFLKYGSYIPPAPLTQPAGRLLFDLLENFIAYPGFLLFGHNFLGLKIPIVLISLLTIYLFRKTVLIITNRDNIISILLPLYLAFDFMFFITSRIQSPVVFSCFGLSIILFTLAKSLEESPSSGIKQVFWLGFFGLFSVLFIYIYNAFVLGALGLFIGYRYILVEKSWKHVWMFTAGIISCFISYNVATYVLMDKTFFDLIIALKHFGGGQDFKFIVKEDIEALSFFTKIKNTIGAFLSTNIFRFNLSFLAVFILALCLNIKQILDDKRDYVTAFGLMFFLMAFCQFFIEPSYPKKKLTIILLMALLLISNVKSETLSLIKGKTSITIIAVILISTTCYYTYSITTQDWWSGNEKGTPQWFDTLNLSILFFTLLLIGITNSKRIYTPKIKYGIALLYLTNLSLIYQYVLANPRFNNKQTLNTLSELYPNATYICGDYANKFLYHNNFKAYLNAHFGEYSHNIYEEKLDSMLENGKVDIVVFERNKKQKTQYQFEERHNITNALERRDTLLKGENYYILVDTILPFSNREFYFGKRQQKDN